MKRQDRERLRGAGLEVPANEEGTGALTGPVWGSVSEARQHPRRLARVDDDGDIISTSGVHQVWVIDLHFVGGVLMCRKRKPLTKIKLRRGLPRLVEIDFPIGKRMVRISP